MSTYDPFQYETKNPLQSKTIWGLIVVLAGMAFQYFGVGPEEQGTAMDLLVRSIELGGAMWAWYGRMKAIKRIG